VAALSIAVVLALTGAACGGSDDDGGDGGTSGSDVPTDITLAAEGEPRTGGTFIYGVEAESDGYNPATNRFAISGTVIGLAIFDPLTAFDADLGTKPYLAESLTPNADFTQWTIKVRPSITFHDGTPLDGAAVKTFLDALRGDPLVGIAASNIASLDLDPADPLAVVVTMKAPWAAFPVLLTGQVGMVSAPSMAGNAEAGRAPVGTGPFVFREWVPDNRFVATKNPDYWRSDGNGTQLPYLDEVEFRPIPDQTARTASIESGTVSMIHTTDPRETQRLEQDAEAGELQIVLDKGEKEESFVMLNTAVAPFDDVRARQALAYATDRATHNAVVNDGLREVADGPFSEGSPWKVDTDYPDYDPARAQELVEEYEAEKGPLEFTFANSGTDTRTLDLLKQQWETVGITANTELVEQSQFILNAAVGDYQAYLWRQFGGADPDFDYIWWHSENSAPPGEGIALNFARNEDPELDAALQQGRSSTDLAVREEAYATVQERMNATIPYIWLDRAEWALVATNAVRGITNGPLPDGSPANPIGGPGGFGGVTFLTQTWLTE
jgi:4-phytase/acid phosphatase/peptide/nickel transport system substrate-binding protein